MFFAFVKVLAGPGRAFKAHCQEIGVDPGEYVSAMIQRFVAEKNMPLPEPAEQGTGLDAVTTIYLKMRDTRAQLKKLYEAEDEVVKKQMDAIENTLLGKLNDNGVDSMKTKSATFYKERVFKPACDDWNAFYDFVREEEDGFRFLERRVTKKAVEDYMKEQGEAPPGISTYEHYEVRVRRGKDN